MTLKKIWVLGGTGSGKTTLAKKISEKLNVPAHSTDEFVFKNNWETKYSPKERDKKLLNFSNKKKWIIEGVHRGDWILPAFKKTDLVIVLNLPRRTLMKRVFTRYIKRKLKNEKPGKLKNVFQQSVKWAYNYPQEYYVYHQNLIKEYNKKFIILKNDKEIKDFLNKL